MLYQLDVVMSVLRYWIDELQGEILERETRLELATPTLVRIPAKLNSHSGQREHPDP
ncbi:hypothetical protein [Aeromonas caviae]|uniref:hypothetical protein n=1 Tax=Aeromonas caviae TaxID=648 RepID=UPI00187D51EB|nr:hypothetical protein [Aeromonas caviae]